MARTLIRCLRRWLARSTFRVGTFSAVVFVKCGVKSWRRQPGRGPGGGWRQQQVAHKVDIRISGRDTPIDVLECTTKNYPSTVDYSPKYTNIYIIQTRGPDPFSGIFLIRQFGARRKSS